MNPLANPIVISCHRIARRTGLVPGVAIAACLGLCGLLAMAYADDTSKARVGGAIAGLAVILEGLVLVPGGFLRISRYLGDERNSGLLDSNRLTTMSATELATGYWLGPAVREFYIAAAVFPFGLIVALQAGLPIDTFLVANLLVVSTAMLMGLLALLSGVAMKRAAGLGMLALIAIPHLGLMALGTACISNLLLPTSLLLELIGSSWRSSSLLQGEAYVFNRTAPALYYALLVQGMVGVFLWLAAVRKFRDPRLPAFNAPLALGLFLVVLLVQHGLIWHGWEGDYSGSVASSSSLWGPVLGAVHVVTVLLGLLLVALAQATPERLRPAARRRGGTSLPRLLARTGLPMCLAAAAIASLAMATHFYRSDSEGVGRWAVASASLFTVYAIISVMLDLARCWCGRKALGMFCLAFFIVGILPYPVGAALESETITCLGLFSPGAVLLTTDSATSTLAAVQSAMVLHGVLAGALLLLWGVSWHIWLDQAGTAAPRVPAAAPAA